MTVDYATMTDPELLAACGDDARKWAQAFCQIKKRLDWELDDIDEALMTTWFANAIENATDVRKPRVDA